MTDHHSTDSSCHEMRAQLLDRRRGRSTPDRAAAIDAHLRECDACTQALQIETALDEALLRIPRPKASPELLARLRQTARPTRRLTWPRVVSALAAAACFAGLMFFVLLRRDSRPSPLVVEAVNDHLRVLYADHPVEIESGGIHQVKPWFAGRLDFAPAMSFAGDADFPLQGGSIAYFLDRKAAAYVFKRRLHVITVLVFRADGLTFPSPTRTIGHAAVTESTTRGFHVFLWKEGDLAYAATSDVDPVDLALLVSRIAP